MAECVVCKSMMSHQDCIEPWAESPWHSPAKAWSMITYDKVCKILKQVAFKHPDGSDVAKCCCRCPTKSANNSSSSCLLSTEGGESWSTWLDLLPATSCCIICVRSRVAQLLSTFLHVHRLHLPSILRQCCPRPRQRVGTSRGSEKPAGYMFKPD